MKLIGMSGRKRSGKDTAASFLVEDLERRGLKVHRIAFADALKAEVCSLLHITREQLEANKDRYRGILQWWGTEWRRQQNPNYWLDRVEEALATFRLHDADAAIITDVRFPNEVEFVESRGGLVVRVTRPGLPVTDTHLSEASLDDYAFDVYLDNSGTLDNLRDFVRHRVLPLVA